MLVDELNQLHSNYINLSTNHSETSRCILKDVTSSSFVVVEQLKRELLKLRSLLERGPGAAAHLHLKGYTQKQRVFVHTQIGANLTSYNNLSVGYFELKLFRHILGTPETYITSCKRGIIGPL